MSADNDKSDIRIGFVPLVDAATLIMAKERGVFEKHGLNVKLEKVSSWARMRDLLAVGDLQAAHMLAPMVIASAMGLEPGTPAFTTSLSLNMNGNAITVSNALFAAMYQADPIAMKERPLTARALKPLVTSRANNGEPPLKFAMVYPFSSHNYQLRYWLAAAGIHPDRDVHLVVVAPPRVTEYMKAGIIDGYCVGEPWNSEAVEQGVGTTLITSQELMGLAPEKVLGVCQSWANENPDTHERLIKALIETSKWLTSAGAAEETASVLASHSYVGVPAKRILPSLTGKGRQTAGAITQDIHDFNVFYRYAANFPWRSHAAWFITQMYRWGQLDTVSRVQEIVERAYRPDIFRDVVAGSEHVYPQIDSKAEGDQAYPWVLTEASEPIAFGPNKFIDDRVFKPEDFIAYLEAFETHSLRVELAELSDENS